MKPKPNEQPECIKRREKWYVRLGKKIVAGPYVDQDKAMQNWRRVAYGYEPDPPDLVRGGTRPGAGRPRNPEPLERRTVRLSARQWAQAEALGEPHSASEGIRRALDGRGNNE